MTARSQTRGWMGVWIGILVLLFIPPAWGGVFHTGSATSGVPAPHQIGLIPSASSASFDYFNQTYHLVNYDPMEAYVNSKPGYQYPTLSSDSEQPAGIYYVQNETDGTYPFVEQSLSTNNVTTIADIIPLYQKFAGYAAMIDNEFFLEYGYDVALFFGTTTLSTDQYSLELVNLSSGYLYMWNTTWKTSAANQQVQYLGNDIVAVISANGTIEGFNLSSRQQWDMYPALLPWFEANNVYWLPQMSQLIDVRADGATADTVEVLGEIPGPEPTFDSYQIYPWGSGIPVNGVNGVAFNASYSSGTPALLLSVGEGSSDGHLQYDVLFTYENSSLSPTNIFASSTDNGNCNDGTTSAGILAQSYVITSSYLFCEARAAFPVENVWDPWNNSYLSTNITPNSLTCYNQCFEGLYAPNISWLLNFNATAILAGGPTNPPYNVVYDYHNSSDPYFTPPGWPTQLKVGAVTTTTIPLSWVNPFGTVLNDTVHQGTVCGQYSTNYSLGSAGTSYTAVGLSSATSYCFAVSSWNSMGQSHLSLPAIGTTLPDAPTSLVVTAVTDSTVSLSWTNPSGTVVNDTVFWSSGSCGNYSRAASTNGASTSATLTGLAQGTRYCLAVEAWSEGGNSTLSNDVSPRTAQVPSAPVDLTIVRTTTSAATLAWTNPGGGGLLNDSVYQGASCGNYPIIRSVGIAGTSYTETGLAPATSYCFAVSAWNSTGQSPLSSTVMATTLPAPPSDLAVSAYNFTSISLSWSNPNGTLVNDTVFWTSGSCGTYSDAASLGYSGTSYTIAGLRPGIVYCVAVLAWSAGGPSVLSLTVTQKTRATVQPVSPWRAVWPPVFGVPSLGPFFWIGLGLLVVGAVVLVRYRRMITGPALIGAGVVLLFLIAV